MNNVTYISIDGNNIGKVLEKYILCNHLEALKAFSGDLSQKIDKIRRLILCNDGTVFLAGGDNVLASVNSAIIPTIIAEVYAIESEDIRFSIGIGESAVSAYLALKYAKATSGTGPVCYMDGLFKSYEYESL